MDHSARNVRMFYYLTFPPFEAICFYWFHQKTFIEAFENGRLDQACQLLDQARQLLRSGADVNTRSSVRINMEQLKFVFLIVALPSGVVVVVVFGVEEVVDIVLLHVFIIPILLNHSVWW